MRTIPNDTLLARVAAEQRCLREIMNSTAALPQLRDNIAALGLAVLSRESALGRLDISGGRP